MDQTARITLQANFFPLEGIVFFPSSTLPLNIFEPRYLSMIQDCLKHGTLLAISDLDPADSATVEPIVGLGLVSVFEERSDGTLVILVRGAHRGRVVSMEQHKPFYRCKVELLAEDSELEEKNRFFLKRLEQGLRDWAEQTLPDRASRDAFLDGLRDGRDSPRRLIETFAHYKLPDVDIRQQLLETSSLDARVELLRRVL